MTDAERQHEDDISVFALGTTLIRERWRIVRWMFYGGVLLALTGLLTPSHYKASASFVPQGTESSGSELASLAGQFGVSLPSGSQSLSPDFYKDLLTSDVLLRSVTRDTFTVEELGGRRYSFLELFEVEGQSALQREEQGIRLLRGLVDASVVVTTGVVELSAETRWPGVSLGITEALVDAVNDFNRRMRQEQAAAERRFVEDRLAVVGAELRDAEERLQEFLKANRQYTNSPELAFQADRLEREIALRQQVFTSLTQTYEEVRVREVRDTPVITMIEVPVLPTLAEPRRTLLRGLLGLVVGGGIGVIGAFVSGMMARGRHDGDADVEEFRAALSDMRGELAGRLRGLRKRIGR